MAVAILAQENVNMNVCVNLQLKMFHHFERENKI